MESNTQKQTTQKKVDIHNQEPSKSQIEKDMKKRKKKVAQSISVLVRAESRTYEELFSKEPQQNLLITHFGNGDEEDQRVLLEYASQFGKVEQIQIFPGTNYGHLVFESKDAAQKLMNDMDAENIKTLKFNDKNRYVTFFYTPIQQKDLRKRSQIDVPNAEFAQDNYIPGLYIYDDFISEEEEKEMIKNIDSQQWIKLLNRRVQHYGYEFIYGANSVNKNKKIGEMPEFCEFLQPKFKSMLCSFEFNQENEVVKEQTNESNDKETVLSKYGLFDQLTINDYLPGQGIPPHVDTHSPFQELFASLSLKSGVTMTFKNTDNQQRNIYLKPRSLVVFTDEVRYNWLHMIAQRKIDKVDGLLKFRHRRISLTFRKIKTDPCKCRYPKLCDSQNKLVAVEQNNLVGEGEEAKIAPENQFLTTATDMEKKHVYEVYEKIAPHFSNTRYKPWPKIKYYLEQLPMGSINCDVGCGNGKYLGVNQKNVVNIGTDRSFNLLEICRKRDSNFQTFFCDSLKLPVRDNVCDSVISVAVIHHFSTKQLRVTAIQEMKRILKIGGKMLIYVWALEQEEKQFQTQDVFVPWHLQDRYEEEDVQQESKESEEEKKSSFIETAIKSEQKKATIYHRYYHVFKQGELDELIEENFAGQLEIKDRYYDHANWVVVCEKLQ